MGDTPRGQNKRVKRVSKIKRSKSCLGCEEINSCDLRDSYVKAVYDSMSRGGGGGFEF